MGTFWGVAKIVNIFFGVLENFDIFLGRKVDAGPELAYEKLRVPP